MTLRNHIRSIADFPRPGIMFRDITTLLSDAAALRAAADEMAAQYSDARIAKVAVVESRGFLIGAIVAYLIGAGLVIIRKRGKLPFTTNAIEYDLEYGTDIIEMHTDALAPGERVLLHDDLLATGGTMAAAAKLVARSGAEIVGASFLIELSFLNGRAVLEQAGVADVRSLVTYDSED